MYYTYVLVSEVNGDMYVGSAASTEKRLQLHNTGRVRSTKSYRPWKLLETRPFLTRSDAVKEERFLKSHQQKEILKEKYGGVAKW